MTYFSNYFPLRPTKRYNVRIASAGRWGWGVVKRFRSLSHALDYLKILCGEFDAHKYTKAYIEYDGVQLARNW